MLEKEMTDFFKVLDDKLIRESPYYMDEYHDNGIHASMLGKGCNREIIFAYCNKPKKELTFTKRLMFWRGHNYHDFVNDAMETCDMREFIDDVIKDKNPYFKLVKHDFNLTGSLPNDLTGSCDLIVDHLDSGKRILMEIKTSMPNMFSLYSNLLPLKHHVIQIQTYAMGYAAMIERSEQKRIDANVIIYFDTSGTNHPLYFEVDSDPKEVMYLLANVEFDIEEYLKNNMLPEIMPLKLKVDKECNVLATVPWNCSYCDYRDITCKSWTHDYDKPKKVGSVIKDTEFFVSKNHRAEEEMLKEFFNKQFPLGI